MAIETLAQLALAAGHDILAPVPAASNSTSLSSAIQPGTELFEALVGGSRNHSGQVINERTAMAVSAVYACTSLIAGAIASLPLPVYRRREGNLPERVDHPYFYLLNGRPSPLMSASTFWTWMLESRLLAGDAFAVMDRTATGQVREIIPVPPNNVIVEKAGGELIYRLALDGGYVTRGASQMLHVPGAGFNGLRGMPVVRYAAAQSIGIAMAADEFNARFFSNGARPDIVLRAEGELNPEQVNSLRTNWVERYGGVANSHMPAVLQGGLDIKQLTMAAEDAQLIETRQFQVEDICRFFGVPPDMIGHSEKTSSWGSGVEARGVNFKRYTLQRHITAFEQECDYKLFPRDPYFLEFLTAGLERGDLKSRYEAHRLALGGSTGPGFATPNEIRRLENFPPHEGGDQLLQWSKNNEATTPAAAQ